MIQSLTEENRWQIIKRTHAAYKAFALLEGLPEGRVSHDDNSDIALTVKRTKKHKVKYGDTLQYLAKKYKCSETDIARINRLTQWPFIDGSTTTKAGGMAVRGQEINVPYEGGEIRETMAMTDSERIERLFYTDIKLQENRTTGKVDAVLSGKDFILITGIEIVRQAAWLRMRRVKGWNIDYSEDGVPKVGGVGDPISLKMFQAQLIAAILIDPRIAEVTKCDVSFAEGVVNVDWKAIAINGEEFGNKGALL